MCCLESAKQPAMHNISCNGAGGETKILFVCFLRFLCACVYTPLHRGDQELEEGVGSPVTGVTGSCDLPCGCRETKLVSPQGQCSLLTAELSLQP